MFKQNSTREFMSNRRVVLRESVSVPTAGIGQIGGAYLRERKISKVSFEGLLMEKVTVVKKERGSGFLKELK